MKKTLNFIPVMIFASLALSFGSCNRSTDDSGTDTKKDAESRNDAKFDKASETDAQFVVDAYSDGMLEVKMAQRIKDRSTTQEGADLASNMISAHTAMNADLEALAAKKQISLPRDLTTAQQDKIDDIAEKQGKEVDKAYADKMVSMHKDAIDLFQKAADNATDPDIKAKFASALPELRSHLDMATNCKDKLSK